MIDQVRPGDLAAWLQAAQAHGRPLVLDVREPWEVQTATVQPADTGAAGFELLCLPMRSIPAHLGTLDASRPVACLCHHGSRSMLVANFLSQQGFTRLANIAGGIDAWSVEVDPTVPRY